MTYLRTILANLAVLLVLTGLAVSPALARAAAGDCITLPAHPAADHAQSAPFHHPESAHAETFVADAVEADPGETPCCTSGCLTAADLWQAHSSSQLRWASLPYRRAGGDIVVLDGPEGLIRPPKA